MDSPRLELVVRHTDRVLSLTPGQTVVAGRTAQCELQLDDPSVSRRHCTITWNGNGPAQVKDLDSANGTFVNERAITEAGARPGDLIRLGAAIIELRDPAASDRGTGGTMMVDESTIESVIVRI